MAMVGWAQSFRLNGRRLLTANPLYGATIPREKNAKRPIATDERYRKLLEKADQADPSGRFRLVLVLARETGRRINAICKLSVRDVLLSREQLLTALGDAGLPLAWASGAIRWREATDKMGFGSVAPLSSAARSQLESYLDRYPRAGDVPLFPGGEKPEQAINKEIAGYWLAKAERLAKLSKMARGLPSLPPTLGLGASPFARAGRRRGWRLAISRGHATRVSAR